MRLLLLCPCPCSPAARGQTQLEKLINTKGEFLLRIEQVSILAPAPSPAAFALLLFVVHPLNTACIQRAYSVHLGGVGVCVWEGVWHR